MRAHCLLAALLLLTVTACGAEGITNINVSSPTLSIEAPEPGARVQVPFTVEVSTNVSLGPPDSDRPSLRIFIDGIEVATISDTTFEVTRDLVPGPHAIHVSLFRPGAEPVAPVNDEVKVTVVGAGG